MNLASFFPTLVRILLTSSLKLETSSVVKKLLDGFSLEDIPEDAKLLVTELVQKHGYQCKIHTVTTSDGYILRMHQISHNRNGSFNSSRYPVLLMHGLLESSADWILAGPEKSLGYILVDAGYDVWLGNARGNSYSRRHIHLDPDENNKFWKFSFHEIGVRDLPAMIDYILMQTSHPKLYYIGYSQGTTIFYVMCSEKPEYNAKIKLQMSLAPAAYINHMISPPMRIISQNGHIIAKITKQLGIYEVFQKSNFTSVIFPIIAKDPAVAIIFRELLFSVVGFNRKQFNTTLLPILLGHTPAGCSVKQLLHYTQLVRSGKFEQFDEGYVNNMRLYNSRYPPEYKIERITAPIYLYYGKNDWLISHIDVNRFYNRLPNAKGKVLIADQEFNHIDFVIAIQAPQLVYSLLIKVMNEFIEK